MTTKRWEKAVSTVGRPSRTDQVDASDWFSAFTGIGVAGKDKRVGTAFVACPISDIEATDLWRGDDIAARVVETVPNEMLRQGFELRIAEPKEPSKKVPGEPSAPGAPDETLTEASLRGDMSGWFERRRARFDADAAHKDLSEQIMAKLEDLGFAAVVHDALCYERAYGGAAILLGVKDGVADLKQPLNPERVRALDWLTVLEPRECQPIAWYNDPTKAKFGDPAIYEVNPQSQGGSTSGSMQVHESRLIIFKGVQVSRRPLPGTIPGWGDGVLTRVYRVLRDFNISWSATAILLNDFSQTVIGVKDLATIMASGNAKALRNRFQQIELGRSIANAVLIDAELETFERKTTTLTGIDAVLDRFGTRLAAACDMPLTLLMGQSPGGLNATGDSDVRFFYDRVRALQDRKLRPVIERVVKMLFKVLGAAEPDSWSVFFCPLWQPSELEGAQARLAQATVDEKYIVNGVLSGAEVAKSRFATDEYSFQTVVDWDARDAGDETAPAPVKSADEVAAEQHDREMAAKALDVKAASAKPFPPGK